MTFKGQNFSFKLIRTAERKAPSITKHNWRRTKQNTTGGGLKIKLATNATTCPVRRILLSKYGQWKHFLGNNTFILRVALILWLSYVSSALIAS